MQTEKYLEIMFSTRLKLILKSQLKDIKITKSVMGKMFYSQIKKHPKLIFSNR